MQALSLISVPGRGRTAWGEATDGAAWAGLNSQGIFSGEENTRYTRKLRELAERYGLPFHAQKDGFGNWEAEADRIIAAWKRGELNGVKIVFIGHSNGGWAAIMACNKCTAAGVPVHALLILDLTIKPDPAIAAGVKHVLHIEGRLSGVALLNGKLKFAAGFDGTFKRIAVGGAHVSMLDAPEIVPALDEVIRRGAAQTGETEMPEETVPAGISKFDYWTPIFMATFMADFNVNVGTAAAVFGNAGHESGGYEKLQELKPVVPGSRGGYGIMQWTGPRRVAFEAYCARNGYSAADMVANYKFLFVELKGPEGRVLPLMAKDGTLDGKTEIFSKTFLRPGIPHMESRVEWAHKALAAWVNRAEPNPALPGAGGERPATPSQEAETVLLAFGSNDWDDPQAAAEALAEAIFLCRAEGLTPLYVPPNGQNQKLAEVTRQCVEVARVNSAAIVGIQAWAGDAIHPSLGECKRIASEHPLALVFGDSIGLGILQAQALPQGLSRAKVSARSATVLQWLKAVLQPIEPVPAPSPLPQPVPGAPAPLPADPGGYPAWLAEARDAARGRPFSVQFGSDGEPATMTINLTIDFAPAATAAPAAIIEHEPAAKETEMANTGMSGNKAAVASVGVWGNLGVIGGLISMATGVLTGNPPAEVGEIVQHGQQIIEGVNQILVIGGGVVSSISAVVGLIGRLVAKEKITGIIRA